jgi:tRNA A37 threonylcarbamoyladenosine synthetase subunit TsaC/SUA5/YrdC
MKGARRLILLAVCFMLMPLLPASAQQGSRDIAFEQALIDARKVSNQLAEKVRGLLLQEIEKGGFPSAVRVCSETAQEITRQFNAQAGHEVRRISLKYRNPQNVPDAYERRRLEEFNILNQKKELPNEYSEIVEEQGKKYLRYLRPLIVVPLCITCHGPKENIPQEVKKILAERYPDDGATGFLVGDVRGAITVKTLVTEGKR